MASSSDVALIRSELRSIEQLVVELLERQTELSSRLACLELSGAAPSPGCSTWTAVVRGKNGGGKRKLSLPLFDPSDFPQHSNQFSPLAECLEDFVSPSSSVPGACQASVLSEGVHSASGVASLADFPVLSLAASKANKPSKAFTTTLQPERCSRAVPRSGKRSARCPLSSSNSPTYPDGSSSPVAKRLRLHDANKEPSSPADAPRPGHCVDTPVVKLADEDAPPLSGQLTVSSAISDAASFAYVLDAGQPVTPVPLAFQFSNFATYDGGCLNGQPEILIIGDSITRFVKIPCGITYCFSGFRILDVLEHAPAIVEQHPSVHTVIIHVGANDVMKRQSERLRSDFETLITTVEGLGKKCILSGPIPSMGRGSERFSRLFGLHCWLQNYCIATGIGYIDNFDLFWTRSDLFRPDGIHPNGLGVKQLSFSTIRLLASLA